MREFPVTLFGQPRPRLRPTYRRTTMLDLMRSERRVRDLERQMMKVATDTILHGSGAFRIEHVSAEDLWKTVH